NDPLLKKIHMDEFAVVPLNTRDKTIGVIVVDNLFNKKPISRDDLRLLTMFANQAGLAIENSRLYEHTVIQSQTDSLTRLWNHGYFQHKIQEEIKAARQSGSYLSLILLDLDNFKELNDTMGHYTGDKILKDVSRLLKKHCRRVDYPCRYGGEEFAIILSQTTKKEAYLIAERIREAIAKHNFSYKKTAIPKTISLSIGLATFGENRINTKNELLICVDKALYTAKHTGKNKTYVYN
ncbi:MAG: GGDEF domain-containing protein, partial [Candidatus Omnitrophota bacterium]